ncbi:MAG: hypothetical protein ACQGVC_12760 [Myxococcota bacterium]
MFPPESERLLTLAEIAVAMAGFSAIVVLFKRREPGTWLATDADRFNGMIVHSMMAAALCGLPMLIGVFTHDVHRLWTIASAVMGLQVAGHAGLVLFYLQTTQRWAAAIVGAGGLTVVVLQVLNVLGIGFDAEFGPYVVGVCWHLFHTGMLFTMLVWVREESIER